MISETSLTTKDKFLKYVMTDIEVDLRRQFMLLSILVVSIISVQDVFYLENW